MVDEDHEWRRPLVLCEYNVTIVKKLALQDQRNTAKLLPSESRISVSWTDPPWPTQYEYSFCAFLGTLSFDLWAKEAEGWVL